MKQEFSHTLDWESISKYLSGEMTEAEREVFEGEMAKDPSYAEAIKASEKDLILADSYLAKEAFDSQEAWNNINTKLSSKQNNKIKRLSPLKHFMKIAASIIILFGIGLLAQTTYKHLYSNKTVVCAANEVSKSITLNDGSVITLNANSKLIYPRKFGTDERRVELSGEAFFDIAKNPNKAFIINAKNAEVKVLGTSFNINAATNKVEVLVKTGKVQFSSINKPNSKLILTPGDFASLQESNLERLVNRDDNYLSWKTRQIIFKNTELQEVAKVLNRTYQVQISFENKELKNLPLTTTFDHDPLDVILHSMCSPFNLVYEKKGKQILIKKAY